MNLKSVLARVRTGPALATAALIALITAGITVLALTTTVPAHASPAVKRPTPAPHILNFANKLSGARIKLPTGPTHVAVPWNVDGCDHAYGTANQCVPWTIPGRAANRCHWLAAHGFGKLKVRGTDRLHLDTNGDRMACNKGDAGT